MSRSGYHEDCENVQLWRTAVAQAIRGRRGQAFLREMLVALDAMEVKRLITDDLAAEGEVCAIGAVGISRRVDMTGIDPHNRTQVSKTFNIAPAMAAEIAYENDEGVYWPHKETPEERWMRMRAWVASNIAD